MQSCAHNILRSFAEAAVLTAIAALALWPKHAATTTASLPHHVVQSDDWIPTSGQLDFTARERTGVASFYGSEFFWRRMANGAPMNPHGNNAASRTLPLGTVARVTAVETGKSAVVRIEDRGPYVNGRIVDLSPSTARQIGITARMGIGKVVVTPIAVPLPDGRVKVSPAARGEDLRLANLLASTNVPP
jgi:rare lipoprotein A (peptidoglycan hydrolase)